MQYLDADIKRFWSKVGPPNSNGCRLWIAGKSSTGYGSFNPSRKSGDCRTRNAHKVAWEMSHGAVPSGMLVCHKCDVPACCEPSHLYLGTRSDNICDKIYRDPIPSERMGLARARFHEGEIWLIRRLKMPDGKEGMRIKYKFSVRFVAKMFKTDPHTIRNIWKAEKYLCKEGYYV